MTDLIEQCREFDTSIYRDVAHANAGMTAKLQEAADLLEAQAKELEELTFFLKNEKAAFDSMFVAKNKQIEHLIEKHDKLLEQQLETVPQEWNDKNVAAWCVARGINAARKGNV